MIQKTAMIAVLVAGLVAGLVAAGSVHAYESAAVQQAKGAGLRAEAAQSLCHDAYYDRGGANLAYREICAYWTTVAGGGYANTLYTDRTFYDQGDLMHVYANQDLRDPQEATAGHFAVRNASGAAQAGSLGGDARAFAAGNVSLSSQTRSAWSAEGNWHTFAVRLLDDLFDPGCYDVSVWYDTPRPDADEAWDAVEFCVVSDEPAGTPPTATGIQGNVYSDANGNGKLDIGEPGVAGMTVIAVNMADFADTRTTATGADGYYSFGLGAGAYLVQVEGTASHAYVSVTTGSATFQHLGL